jgi:ABC-type hemin transport system ATPase subunit
MADYFTFADGLLLLDDEQVEAHEITDLTLEQEPFETQTEPQVEVDKDPSVDLT